MQVDRQLNSRTCVRRGRRFSDFPAALAAPPAHLKRPALIAAMPITRSTNGESAEMLGKVGR